MLDEENSSSVERDVENVLNRHSSFIDTGAINLPESSPQENEIKFILLLDMGWGYKIG